MWLCSLTMITQECCHKMDNRRSLDAFNWQHLRMFHCQWTHNQVFLLLSHMLIQIVQIIFIYVGWSTAGILQSTPPVWELQDPKWRLNLSVHKPKCLTLMTPALSSWRPKNDITMKSADLWRGTREVSSYIMMHMHGGFGKPKSFNHQLICGGPN